MPPKFGINKKVLEQLVKNTPDKLDRWLAQAMDEIRNDVVLSMNTSPSGRKYKRGDKEHTASVAGYPPNVDFGALIGSIKVNRIGRLRYKLEDGVRYGYWLEMGTSRIAPRPFIRPVIDTWRRKKLLDHAKKFRMLE